MTSTKCRQTPSTRPHAASLTVLYYTHHHCVEGTESEECGAAASFCVSASASCIRYRKRADFVTGTPNTASRAGWPKETSPVWRLSLVRENEICCCNLAAKQAALQGTSGNATERSQSLLMPALDTTGVADVGSQTPTAPTASCAVPPGLSPTRTPLSPFGHVAYRISKPSNLLMTKRGQIITSHHQVLPFLSPS